jgi:glyoxylase-like metal-dependent hydrolase (beta-lactamase superfamily II)
MAACYLLEENGHAAFIDCGTWHSVPHMLDVLEQKSISREAVDYVIPTHIHLDHAGGAGELMRHLPKAKLIVHPFGAKHLVNPERIQQGAIAVYGKSMFRDHYHEIVPVDAHRVIEAPDGFKIDLNGRELVFLDTPGHASHHFCVWDERTCGFFTGDTFGLSYRETDVEGRPLLFPTTTPVQFKPDKWLESLEKLERYNPEVMYLTHFGPVYEVSRLMEVLREDIRIHHAIAANCMDAAEPESEIRKRLLDRYLNRMKEHGVEWSREQMTEFVSMDLELNTQGLLAWIDRNR